MRWWPLHGGPAGLLTGEAGTAQDVPSLQDSASAHPPHRLLLHTGSPQAWLGTARLAPPGLACVSPSCSEGQQGIVTVAPEAVHCLHVRKEAYGPSSAARLRSSLWPYRFHGT